MNINNRICTQIGHDKFYATHLCIVKNCDQELKWSCIQCITQGIHNHNQKDQTHLIPWHDIIIQKKEEVIQFQSEHFICRKQVMSKGLQQCNQIHKLIQEYQQFFQQQIQKIIEDQLTIQSIIDDLSQENFIQLDNQRICELLYFNKNSFIKYPMSLIKPLDNIDKNINQLENLIQDYQNFWRINISTYDFKLIKYQVKQIDQTNSIYHASQISDDQRFLVYGGADGILKIYSIQLDKIIQEIKVDYYFYVCQFTFDSSQLFVGMAKGYVNGYDLQNNYKLIFRQQIHQDQVCNIRTIQNKYLITCSNDRTITKTDIKSKQQIFIYTVHTEFVGAIDYDEMNDMIISGSDDKSIKLWDCKNKCIIVNKVQSHPNSIRQIQFINNKKNILSLDQSNNLYKWKIDIIKKDLYKIQEFQDANKIYNFQQITQNLNLLLICEQYIKILDDKGETINIINHQAGDFSPCIMECRQLDNCRYIHVRSKQKLLFAKALN